MLSDTLAPNFGLDWMAFASRTPWRMGLHGVGDGLHWSLPAPFVVEAAEALEAAHVDQLWVIEDCFYTAGESCGDGTGPY